MAPSLIRSAGKSIKTSSAPLTVPALRVLRALAGGGALTRGRIELEAGSAGDLPALETAGLARHDVIEMDGGLTERVWQITDAGRAALARSAPTAVMRKAGEALDIGALAPWYGSARRQAAQVGEACRGAKWVGIPFAGSLCEVPAILAAGANAVGVNDAHRHLVNLGRVAADPKLGAALVRRLRRTPFCIEALRASQAACAAEEPGDEPGLELAVGYFVCCWLSRSAEAGKLNEFRAGLAIRYGAGGGNSVLRFANAVGGLPAWRRMLQRCSLSADDAFDFLARCNDRDDAAIYCDPPWPDVGKGYKHSFREQDHERLATSLNGFAKARLVVRAGEHPLPRKLYGEEDGWRWLALHGRNQGNRESTEWLIVKRGRAS